MNVSLYSERINAETYSPLACYQNALGDDQTDATLDALHIILLHDLAWVGVWGTIPGKRGHHESVLQGDTPELERGEESFCGHFECKRKQVFSEDRENWTLLASIATTPCFYSTSKSVISTRRSSYFAYHHNRIVVREISNFCIASVK